MIAEKIFLIGFYQKKGCVLNKFSAAASRTIRREMTKNLETQRRHGADDDAATITKSSSPERQTLTNHSYRLDLVWSIGVYTSSRAHSTGSLTDRQINSDHSNGCTEWAAPQRAQRGRQGWCVEYRGAGSRDARSWTTRAGDSCAEGLPHCQRCTLTLSVITYSINRYLGNQGTPCCRREPASLARYHSWSVGNAL